MRISEGIKGFFSRGAKQAKEVQNNYPLVQSLVPGNSEALQRDTVTLVNETQGLIFPAPASSPVHDPEIPDRLAQMQPVGGNPSSEISASLDQQEAAASQEAAEKPSELLIVIIDDDPSDVRRAENAAKIGLNGEGKKKENAVCVANNADELFNLAMTGNQGRQADVVLTDGFLGLHEWVPSEECLKKHGLNTSALPEKFLVGLGLNYAALLRLAGFEGKVVLISGDPAKIRDIERTANLLDPSHQLDNYGRPMLNGVTLINGVLHKTAGYMCSVEEGYGFAYKVKYGWTWREAKTFSEAVEILIRES